MARLNTDNDWTRVLGCVFRVGAGHVRQQLPTVSHYPGASERAELEVQQGGCREGDRESERERGRERERDRERKRERERKRDGEKERERENEKQRQQEQHPRAN